MLTVTYARFTVRVSGTGFLFRFAERQAAVSATYIMKGDTGTFTTVDLGTFD